MKRMAAALVLVLSPMMLSAGEPATDTAWVDQSRQLAMQLGGQLKAELTNAIAEGGPMAAINVCYLRAPEIAAQLSQASGARVGRTALRVRNPSNAPDDLERTVLEQFAADLGSGPIDRPLEAVFEIRRGDAVERRYMRAIPTERLGALTDPVVSLLGSVAGLSAQQMLAGSRALRDEMEARA
mgnify:CR=1 FL=1